MILELSNFVQR